MSIRVLGTIRVVSHKSYRPTRFEAQADAVSLIFSAKTQANPESSVGLMTMGGDAPEVLVTLTTDIGKMLAALHTTKIKGEISLSTALQVAQVSSLMNFGGSLPDHTIARPQAQIKQESAAAYHRLCMLPNT